MSANLPKPQPHFPDIVVFTSSSRDIIVMHEVEIAMRKRRVPAEQIDAFLVDAFAAPTPDAVMHICKQWVQIKSARSVT